MRMITFTKKKIKRIVAISSLAAATAAVGIVAIVTSVGTHAAERMLPIYNVERGDNKISLTFDVAWENSNTDELIEILDEYGARATFFVTGDWCDRYPNDVRAFHDAGHEIQNHSDQHPHVEGINVNDLISDTRNAAQKISSITGEEPDLYRAPYGEYDDSMIITLEGMGYKVIQWDVERVDTDGKAHRKPRYGFRCFCAGFSIGFGFYIPIHNLRIYLFDNPANIILSKLLYLKYAKGLFLISRSFRKSVCVPDL